MSAIQKLAMLMFVLFASGNAFAAKHVAVEKPMAPPSKATALFFKASSNANFEMMDTYLARGADIDCGNCESRGRPPLAMALSEYGINMDLVRYLVKHGANVNLLTQGAMSPLMFAISNPKWSELVQAMTYLVDSGANVKLTNSDGQNALFYLVAHGYDQYSVKTSLRLMRYLVDQGTNVNHQSADGRTALMFAAGGCGIDSVQLLLFLGADPNLKNKLGDTALSIAEDTAAGKRSGGSCNQVVAMLREPEQFRINPLSNSDVIGAITQSPAVLRVETQAAPQGVVATADSAGIYAGNYAGTFAGSDDGTFQVTVLPNGMLTLEGYTSKGDMFTGEGRVNSDGYIKIGSASTGASFIGVIGQDRVSVSGNWRNANSQSGSFQGKKGAQFVKIQPPPANPLQAFGGFLNGLNKILAPQPQH